MEISDYEFQSRKIEFVRIKPTSISSLSRQGRHLKNIITEVTTLCQNDSKSDYVSYISVVALQFKMNTDVDGIRCIDKKCCVCNGLYYLLFAMEK